MKVLLMKPINDVYYVIQPNLGLGYLAAVMEDSGHSVCILDSGKEKFKWEDFTVLIQKEKYDLVGIQMFTHEVVSARKHVCIIKKYSPNTIVICGGAHVSGDPQGTMHLLKDIDFGFVGEAEIGIEKFMSLKKEDYANYELLKTIPNLVWRLGEKIIVNPRESFKDLDRIKFPAWHLLSISSYPTTPHGTFCKKKPVAPIIISRGCPFQCTFCAGKSITGKTIRYRSVNNVITEIMSLHNKYGVKEIHIEDDNFTLKKDYVVNFCNEIIKLGLDVVFALPNGVRLDTLDEEVLSLIEKAGFYSMAIGVESGSDRILALMKKNLSRESIKNKIDLIKKITKINLTGFFLIGYPGESEKEILETIDFAKTLKLDKASFMFLMPLPGSDLWDIYKRKEVKFDWDNFFYYRVVEGLSDIPVKNLKKLHRKAILEFYLRPKIISGLIKEIKTYTQIKTLGERLFNIFISALHNNKR
ncbi:MAG: radical SAM protein [Candidatus Omnitrophota bacterium]|nr:radical SAM protein [Candidatus Omnitrophota bacterium]